MSNQSELIQYDILEGVERIDGQDVSGQTTIMLTEIQAAYDVAQGRLVRSKPKRAPKKEAPKVVEPDLIGDEATD